MLRRPTRQERWLTLCALTVLAVAPLDVAACSCAPHTADPNEIEARLGWADAAFVGTSVGDRLVSTERCSATGNCLQDERRVHSVTVDTAVAGVEEEATLEIETHVDGATCGSRLLAGVPYLIYANRSASKRLQTGLCSAWPANGDVTAAEIDYLYAIQGRVARRWIHSATQLREFLDEFFREQVAGYEIEPQVISFLWHDLDADEEDELAVYFTTRFQSPPKKAGPWVETHRPGITVFDQSGDNLIDFPPVWIRWCDDKPQFHGQLSADGGALFLTGCDDQTLRLTLLGHELIGDGWKKDELQAYFDAPFRVYGRSIEDWQSALGQPLDQSSVDHGFNRHTGEPVRLVTLRYASLEGVFWQSVDSGKSVLVGATAKTLAAFDNLRLPLAANAVDSADVFGAGHQDTATSKSFQHCDVYCADVRVLFDHEGITEITWQWEIE